VAAGSLVTLVLHRRQILIVGKWFNPKEA